MVRRSPSCPRRCRRSLEAADERQRGSRSPRPLRANSRGTAAVRRREPRRRSGPATRRRRAESTAERSPPPPATPSFAGEGSECCGVGGRLCATVGEHGERPLNREVGERRSYALGTERLIPSPVVPSAKHRVDPHRQRRETRDTARSSSSASVTFPRSRSGVRAAAIVLGLTAAMLLVARARAGVRPARPERDATSRSAVHGGHGARHLPTRGARLATCSCGARSTRSSPSSRRSRRFGSSTTTPVGSQSLHRAAWVSFVDQCRPYDGPALVYFVAGCKAPDGTYWAIQSWQRLQPLLGFDPWLPEQTAYELHLSHWNSELAKIEVYTHWTYGGSVAGRLRALHVPRPADLRVRLDGRGQPEGPLRAERLHRHVQFGLRAGLEA